MYNVPYSRKYWRELNLAVGPQIAIANMLADVHLAVHACVVEQTSFAYLV